MIKRGASLSLLMKLVALIALHMAFLRRAHPYPDLIQFPLTLLVLVTVEIIIIRYFILGRRIGSFLCTFLIVVLVASFTINTFCGGTLSLLATSIGPYQRIPGPPVRLRQTLGYLAIADRYVTSALVLLLSWAAGLSIALVRRRQLRPGILDRRITPGRRTTSFFKGAIVGFGAFTVLTFSYLSQMPAPLTYYVGYIPLLGMGLAISLLLGGAVALLFSPPPPS